MNKCLVLFVEGETEVEFYKKLIAHLKQKLPSGKFKTHLEYKNVGGVGGFKNIALRKFQKEIKPKYNESCEFTIVLCSDTDVFEFSPKPPVDWEEIRIELIAQGASKVILLLARQSIEDWFLKDLDGILCYLRLSKKTKVSGSNGYRKLQRLYGIANKVYLKGGSSKGLVDRLDMDLISKAVSDQLCQLYEVFGINIV